MAGRGRRLAAGLTVFLLLQCNVVHSYFTAIPKTYALASLSVSCGVLALSALRDGDRVLISEGCTHRRQCGDIGTVKLPAWIERYCGERPNFSFTSGSGFPDDLSGYRLIVHCGGCMLNEKPPKRRQSGRNPDGELRHRDSKNERHTGQSPEAAEKTA